MSSDATVQTVRHWAKTRCVPGCAHHISLEEIDRGFPKDIEGLRITELPVLT